jgi:hypothetical protein
MARNVLSSIIDQEPLAHTFCHDLESFIYVVVYAVMKKESNDFYEKLEREIESDRAKLRGLDKAQSERRERLLGNILSKKTAMELVSSQISRQFGHSSFHGILGARATLSNTWKSFMIATKGRIDATNLHTVVAYFLEAAAAQNPAVRVDHAILAKRLRAISKNLDATDLMEVLQAFLALEEGTAGTETSDDVNQREGDSEGGSGVGANVGDGSE